LRQLGDIGVRRRFRQNPRPHLWIAQPLTLLVDRERFNLFVARAHREGIECSADPHHHADRPAGDLRRE
jgi:hypothetical protein